MNRLFLITIVAFGAVSMHLGDHIAAGKSLSQSGRTSGLQAEIERMDSLLFAAFNARDVTALQTFFAPDLEFYQDNEGLQTYAQTMKDFGDMFRQPSPIRREIIAGSLEVYPIKNYGAIQVGSHRFCHDENGKADCGTFKFLHVWRKTETSWQLSRIVSYAH
jgi:ketosteroid isomerase-like protein